MADCKGKLQSLSMRRVRSSRRDWMTRRTMLSTRIRAKNLLPFDLSAPSMKAREHQSQDHTQCKHKL